jgi:hypothetical protein
LQEDAICWTFDEGERGEGEIVAAHFWMLEVHRSTIESPSRRSNATIVDSDVVHQWYQIIMGFDWKLVNHIIDHLGVQSHHLVLDPFCGAGTTLVQCKKQGIQSVGITAKLEDENLQNDYEKIDRLQLKRSHMQVMESFPYDFMNLDFCDYYYPRPPNILRINETIRKVLEWQRRRGDDEFVETGVEISDFVLAVTCRHDELGFPREAEERLAALISQNCETFEAYKQRVVALRGNAKIADWARRDKQDFFFAGWPKDIAQSAKEFGWSMTILDYVYYSRVGDSGAPYIMACLIARFSRAKARPDYLPAVLHALERDSRIYIEEIDPASKDGKSLLGHLAEIVDLRNEQARRKQVPELPDPSVPSGPV